MNILLLAQAVPFPPDSGPKVKTYHVLRHMAARHRVTLVTFTHTAQEEAHADALRAICAEVHTVPIRSTGRRDLAAALRSLLYRTPFLVERNHNAAMHNLLGGLVLAAATAGRPFDLVHADQIHMAQFADPLPLPRLLDQHNLAWMVFERLAQSAQGLQRWLYQREARLLRRYEGRIASTFEAVTVVSEEDRSALQAILPTPREVPVIPIAVDCDAEQPVERAPDAQAILNLASMHWPPNVDGVRWFADRIYPLVRRAVPHTRVYICGPRPPAEVCAVLEQDATIEVTGYVVDPKPYIANAACLIVPLRSGSGMRVQILEALARGIPVVSTTIGCEGIDLVPGRHVLIADTPSDFADAVSLLLRDPELGARMADAGRKRVLEMYDWRAVVPAMETIYTRIAAPRRRGEPTIRSAMLQS